MPPTDEAALIYVQYPSDSNRLSSPLRYRIRLEYDAVVLEVEASAKAKRKGIQWTRVKTLHRF